ncbi:SNF1-related protein kinase regulatory subunit gamma-like PV42a [Canna indica]|uniref:SNF1-related protein kinase regulatory subunit gamma-like PV42a n=1 Tax=Canna indica TaxID=4628 RepID=A0AAQ3JL74_9LILI|nr:SNF1-related protein kinase regulatory subunit gamma-like PV42a [Canna indica]
MAEMQEVKPAQRATKAKEEEEASEGNKKMKRSAFSWLRERKVRELVRDKRRLVEVPYTATLAHTVNAFVANRISAVPVAAPPGHWIGAGGSMILESDRATGAVRKHYIGMVTMLDVLAHIAAAGDDEDGQESDRRRDDDTAAGQQSELDRRMAVAVSTVIGHSLEGLSLWTLNPNTSLLDCMETFSKGVHRALVPVESQMNHAIAVELVEASPGYKMLTQMDVLSFLREQSQQVKDILSHGVTELGAASETIFAVSKNARVIDIIKTMRAAGLSAVPVVDRPLSDDQILQEGKGKRVIETFSATDLGECPIDLLRSWLGLTVTEFKGRLRTRARVDGRAGEETRKGVIACGPEARLVDVMEMAVSNHVHRVWVVEGDGMLKGLVSITDMLRVIRDSNGKLTLFDHLPFPYLLRYVCEESNTNISGVDVDLQFLDMQLL